MIFRFRSGSVTSFKPVKKLLGPIEDPQIQMQVRGKGLLHLIAFARPQHPVVDKDAGQLVADGPMGQRRGHRRIHSAAQRADDAFLPTCSRICCTAVST